VSIDVTLLRDTLELTLERDDDFAEHFYRLLFSRRPDLQPLFHRSSRGAMSKMFTQKLVAIVDHIEDPVWIEHELGHMAASHVGYGVSAEMYAPVGEALIDTLREACGESWTPEAERAWRSAYAALSAAMSAEARA
jgi:hemoglobin-like flavoprotein